MAGTTDLSVSGVFPVMGTMSIFTFLLPNQFSQVSFANPDHIARILTFLSLTRSYSGARALVYTRKQEGKNKKRKESGEGLGGERKRRTGSRPWPDRRAIPDPFLGPETRLPDWYPTRQSLHGSVHTDPDPDPSFRLIF